MAKKRLKGYSLSWVRVSLYLYWIFIVASYLAIFLICRFSAGFSKNEVDDAIRQILSIMVPVLAAFLAFWFDDLTHIQAEDADRVAGVKVFGIFSATVFAHLVVWGYLCIALFSLDFPDESEQSFQGVVRQGFTLLAVCSVLMTAPVAYALKRKVSLGQPDVPLQAEPTDAIR